MHVPERTGIGSPSLAPRKRVGCCNLVQLATSLRRARRAQIRDEAGFTVFGAALSVKDQNVAAGLLRREPSAVEETDSKGMTYLHAAIAASDADSVKFLIKLGVNVNTRVKVRH